MTATLAGTAAPVLVKPTEDQGWDDRSIYRAGLIDGEQGILERLPHASVYHIDLRIADDLTRVAGQQQVRYINAEAVALDNIYLRLFPNATGGAMSVANVTVNGHLVDAASEHANTALRVPLASPLSPGSQIVIALDYVITVPMSLSTGYGLLSYVDGVLALDSPYAAIPVYDDEGWNVEIPPDNADLSYFDVAFYVVRVTAPAELLLAATGVEIAHEQDATGQVVTFAAGPVRDFYLAASADYQVISVQEGQTRVNSYAPLASSEAARRAAGAAARSLQHFGARFGPYPYSEMDVFGIPLLALGIEYPGITGIALRLYDPAERVSGLPSQAVLESTVSHEMAHQWFYNLVGSDQVDEPWLDESLAQYATGLYYEDVYGPDTAGEYRESWASRWERVDRAEIPIGLTAAEYSPLEYSAIVYGRGPFFLDALADQMGQTTFDGFLADYSRSYRWAIASRVEFQALAEKHCACSLTDLFAAWVDHRD